MRTDQHIGVNGEFLEKKKTGTLPPNIIHPASSTKALLWASVRAVAPLLSSLFKAGSWAAAAPGQTPIVRLHVSETIRLRTMQSDDALNEICRSGHCCCCCCCCPLDTWTHESSRLDLNVQNVVTYLGFLWCIILFTRPGDRFQPSNGDKAWAKPDSRVITL